MESGGGGIVVLMISILGEGGASFVFERGGVVFALRCMPTLGEKGSGDVDE